MVRPTFIYLSNHFHLFTYLVHHYRFMINLEKRSGSSNAANDLSTTLRVPSITEHKNVKVFDIITMINETELGVKHMSCV